MKMTLFLSVKDVTVKVTLLLLTFILCSAISSKTNEGADYSIDIAVKQERLGNCRQVAGNEVTFIVKVFRQDTIPLQLKDIIIKDSLSSFLSLLSYSTSSGKYDPSTGLWSNVSVMPGDTAKLQLTVRINENYDGGVLSNDAWLIAMDSGFIDLDSTPNYSIYEDDFSEASVSVPMYICTNRHEKIELSAQNGLINYQWFKNGIPINNITSTIIAESAGEYSMSASNSSNCLVNSCCPIYVEEKCHCPIICVPVRISLTKEKTI